MIVYSPFATLEYTQNLLNTQGYFYDNYILRYVGNNVQAVKNGVDYSKEFIEKYHKTPLECIPKIQMIPYDECYCNVYQDETNINKLETEKILKNLSTSNIWVYPYIFDISCLKLFIKHCQIFNNVVNPYELLCFVLSTYALNGEDYDLEYFFNYFDVCLELKKRGYAYKQLKWEELSLLRINFKDFDINNIENIFKDQALNICKNYYDYNNKKVDLLKEFGF